MMEIRSTIKEVISKVENHAQQKLQFRTEIEYLMDLAERNNFKQLFDDLIFRAKFITNAYNLLSRVGAESSETTKLSIELKKNLDIAFDIIRRMISKAPDELRTIFRERFEGNDNHNRENLFGFLYELSLLKNYFLDKRTI